MTRFSSEWYAARQKAHDDKRRAEIDQNCEFVEITGMGVSRLPAPAKSGQYPPKRLPGPALKAVPILERDVLPVVLLALRMHPKVAWAERLNTGAAVYGERYVRFGWPGMLEITGQLKDGRRLDVEAKRPGKWATPDQSATIEMVVRHGGVAFVAHGVDDVIRELG